MTSRRRACALAILAAIAGVIPLLAIPAPSASAAVGATTSAGTPRARSVLIILLPATSWNDIRATAPPNLTRLFRESAMANLATRSVASRTDAATGYLTFGAGARSIANSTAAATNLDPNERYAGLSAAEVFQLRTGHEIGPGIGALGWPTLRGQNDTQSYGEHIGALGQALADAKIGRRVIANADEQDPDVAVLHRDAALTLTDTHGRVRGTVSGLVRRDPAAPFGLALDNDAVMTHFPSDFQTRRQVVAVEASDLARADHYRPLVTSSQRDVQHADAMRATDDLVGRMLARVDLRRDAVVVVSAYHSSRARTLTVAAIHAPGIAPGLLESATTRRRGFVQIVDVAPTILDLVGIERPDAMEGRAARVQSDSTTYSDRLDSLITIDRASQFRDATIGQATATLVTVTIVLVVLAAFGFGYYRRRWLRVVLRWASLGFLGYVAATFIVGILPAYKWDTGTYFTIVVVIAIAFAGISLALGRRHLVDPLLIALGAIVTMHLLDLVSGAHLELNTVFGYSPTVGIRFAGVGNQGSAQLCAAALLFAILLPTRAPQRGPAIGYVLLLVTFVVVAAPMFGQDFGGALSLGPTIALWWLLRSGRRINLRAIAILVGVLVAAGLVAGFVDLSRPANERTHIGRLFEKVGSDGFGSFVGVVGRKASLMFSTFSNTAWLLAVLSVLVGLVLAGRRSDLLARTIARVPTLQPGLICFGVVTALATALNDSGVQVTGMMLATLLPVLVFLATRVEDDPALAATDGLEDSPPAIVTGERAPIPARSPA